MLLVLLLLLVMALAVVTAPECGPALQVGVSDFELAALPGGLVLLNPCAVQVQVAFVLSCLFGKAALLCKEPRWPIKREPSGFLPYRVTTWCGGHSLTQVCAAQVHGPPHCARMYRRVTLRQERAEATREQQR